MSFTLRRSLAVLAAAGLLGACTAAADDTAQEAEGPRVIQAGAPGEPNRELGADELAELDLSGPPATEADVRFMQMMLPHHAQALEMTRLVPTRSSREDVPLFAERMDISQLDEIAQIEAWLETHEAEVPDLGEGHDAGDHSDHGDQSDHGGELMRGMLTPEQLAELEAASGTEFDRLFLERMRGHHLGAIQMVEELFDDGGGQELALFQFATHVDSDQRIEISRIDMMLAELDAASD